MGARARRARRRPTPTWSCPVPDSGVPAALGYAQACGIPYELGIIRNHYVGRTFIQPTQSVRELGVRLKHSANRAVVEGKRIVLVDDSLVRGTTSVKIVRMMREAGAREVHFRIACPPITHPDFYGIDTPEQDKLLAATHDLEGMRDYIGADSPRLPVDRRALPRHGRERPRPARPQFTDHCFTGDYPTPLTDLAVATPSRLVAPRRSRLTRRWTSRSPDRVAVVTGASRGIGRAAAARLRRGRRACRSRWRARQGALEELDDAIRAVGRRRDARAGRPQGLRRPRPARRRDPRALGQARHPARQRRHPRRARAAHPYRPAGLGRR